MVKKAPDLEKRFCERKNIHRLYDDKNDIISDKNAILEEIYTYYKQLYSNSNHCPQTNLDLLFNNLDIPKLSTDSQACLEKPITKKELYRTLISMKRNKSPGIDGLPVEFYIVFWQDTSNLLMNSLNFSRD